MNDNFIFVSSVKEINKNDFAKILVVIDDSEILKKYCNELETKINQNNKIGMNEIEKLENKYNLNKKKQYASDNADEIIQNFINRKR